MKAIILSAGQGRRLLPLTENQPKCAVPVAGAPILEWQLRALSQCPGVDEVVVVTGFATDQAEAIIDGFQGGALKVRALYNPFYAASDNLGTCWVARHEMDGPFVLVNGDTLFSAAILQRLLQAPPVPVTLTVDRKAHYDDDDMKVILREGRVVNVGKKLDRSRVNGESIGMTRFDGEGAALFRAELERSMRFRAGLGLWYLSAIDTLARKHPVGACLIEGMDWCEIDTREDIDNADRLLTTRFREMAPVRSSAQGG